MAYVDGFLLPIPKRNLPAYRRMAKKAGKIWREHGALEYRECVGDDLDVKMVMPFPRCVRVKRGEGWGGMPDLGQGMEWLRHHDKYDDVQSSSCCHA